MTILEEITQQFILNSKNILDNENPQGDYKDFLESISKGICARCGTKLEIIYVEESDNSFKYKFACGHAHNGLFIKDAITVRDSFKIVKRPAGLVKFISEHIQGWFPSNRTDLSPDGVYKTRVIDRENDYYKEYIVDAKTERVIRDVEEKLSEHRN